MSGARETIAALVVVNLLVFSLIEELAIVDVRRQDRGPRPGPGDADGDGILDVDDACPVQPEVYNGFRDQDGCPDLVGRTRAS